MPTLVVATIPLGQPDSSLHQSSKNKNENLPKLWRGKDVNQTMILNANCHGTWHQKVYQLSKTVRNTRYSQTSILRGGRGYQILKKKTRSIEVRVV